MTKLDHSRADMADTLKSAREAKKLSVQKVAKILQLPESTIHALEDPQDESLPASNLKGLVKRYAKVLGVVHEIAELPETKVNHSDLKMKEKIIDRSTFVLSKASTIAFITVVLLVVLAYSLWQAGQLATAPVLEIDSPSENSIVDKPAYLVSGSSNREATVLVNGDPVSLDENGQFITTVYLQPGYNAVSVSAINSFGREAVHTRTIYYQQ